MLEYRSEVDGLRAVAILSVLLFHAKIGLPGGFVGVDVFFVISGFLITSLILRKTDQNRFSLKEFWVARIRRIAPALIVMVLAVLAICPWFVLPKDLMDVARSAYLQPVAGANFHFWADSDYFAAPLELKPLLHTWSLAVEEQFYLLLPLLLIALRKFPRRTVVVVLSAIAGVSFVFSVFAVTWAPTTAFFLLPARTWELLMGSLLACRRSTGRTISRFGEALSWLGLAGILVPCLNYDSETPFPGLAAVPPVLGTALIILTNADRKTRLGRWLSWKPLVGIGLISYSLYLWHWPLFALTKYWLSELSLTITAILIIVSFLLGYLSWRFVETPIRQNRFHWSHARLVSCVLGLQFVIIVIGATCEMMNGFPQRLSPEMAALETRNFWWDSSDEEVAAGKLKPIGVDDSHTPATFLLWGDSHGRAIAESIHELAKNHGVRGYCAIHSQPVSRLVPRPEEQSIRIRNRHIEEFIASHKIKHVFLVQRWCKLFEYLNPESDEFEDYSPAQMKEMNATLPALVDRLRAKGSSVYVMQQIPRQKGGDFFRQQLFSQIHFPEASIIDPISLDEYERREAFWIKQLAGLHDRSEVEIMHIHRTCFTNDGESRVFVNGRCCYRDDNHLSNYGAKMLISPLYSPIFARIREEQITTSANSRPPVPIVIAPDMQHRR